MRKPTTRETVYLVILTAVLLGWMFIGENSLTGGGSAKEEDLKPIGEAPTVNLARLNHVVPDFDKNGRNLFKYGSPPRVDRPAPPPVVQAPRPDPPKINRPPRPVQPRNTEPPKPAAPRPPQPNFKYLGHLGPKADRIAVFEAGEDMVLARSGDVVETQFKVVDFKYEVVVLGYTDQRFSDQTTELTIRR